MSEDLVSFASVVPQDTGGPEHFTFGLLDWLSIVQGLQVCQVLDVSFHEVCQFEHETASLGSVQGAPFGVPVESFLGSCYGQVDISLEEILSIY